MQAERQVAAMAAPMALPLLPVLLRQQPRYLAKKAHRHRPAR
jgi:hypothetical protein